MSAYAHAYTTLGPAVPRPRPEGGQTMAATAGALAMTPRSKPGFISTPRTTRNGGAVPFLPGYMGIMQKERHHRSQTLAYGPGGVMDKQPHTPNMPPLDLSQLEAMKDPHHRYNKTAPVMTHEERESARDSARNSYRPAVEPAWLKHDGQVLRFFAYFEEMVKESPVETHRVRECAILFFLEDETTKIVELKEDNAGMPQGLFLKRLKIPKPDGSGHFTYRDFQCGTSVTIYAHTFRITSCDDFTRRFLEESVGQYAGDHEVTPLDSFRVKKAQSVSDPVKPKGPESEFIKLAFGGGRRNQKLDQYLEHDKKVLCFWCYWDDPTRYGSRMYYKLHYYLCDDSVEIVEQLARNSGRTPLGAFWRRGPLRKNPHVAPAPGMVEPEPILYKPEDFVVGDAIKVYGRDVVLYRCDDFTRDFYRTTIGYEQGEITIEKPVRVHQTLSHPPHTGFGSEEDSLASCKHLTPRAPKRDVARLMDYAGRALRFEARTLTGAREDATRRFVIAVWLADDSVQVWEKRQRNSGHTEGRFSQKARRKNPRTGAWFQAKDFFVGETVEITSMPFHLLNADESTLKYMEDNPHEFPAADIRGILGKFGETDRTAFRSFIRSEASTAVLPEKLGALVEERFGVSLCSHEVLTAIRALSSVRMPTETLSDRPEILDNGVAQVLS